jgi:hypothetical protein
MALPCFVSRYSLHALRRTTFGVSIDQMNFGSGEVRRSRSERYAQTAISRNKKVARARKKYDATQIV